jgi:UDP-N-acetylmuramoyl-L-alanyl-D-glutamate--2,6-diaminopimelate ligase
LVLNRVYKTDFSVGVFTNLTQDHLDFHQNKEKYFKAKEKLFTEYNLKKAVINIDDSYGERILTKTAAEVMTVGIKGKGDIQAKNIKTSMDGITFIALTPKGNIEIVSRLFGCHNVYNILFAIGSALALGLSLEEIKRGVYALSDVPGRSQRIDEGQNFTVLVDYAHTDDALKNTIKAARDLANRKIITVFGCGGNRDQDKRPKMGEVAGRYSDFTIITSDNPRKYCVILDRKQAIDRAIQMAGKDDIVIIAGKGHEDYQVFRDRRIHFDDLETAKEIIKKLSR